jgi:lipoprotein-releasing system permease protein
MYRLFLSLRFLRHHWLMTLIGSFFVGASLVILVVVMSVMDGFQAKLKETISGASADLTLTPAWPADLVKLSQALEEMVPGVVAAGPYYETITLTRRAGKIDPVREKMHYAAVFGIDPHRETRVNRFREYLAPVDDEGRRGKPSVVEPDDPFKVHDPMDRASEAVGVVIGRGLQEDLRVPVGHKIRVAIAVPPKESDPQATKEDVSLKYKQLLVVGVYHSGNSEIDRSCIFMDHRAFTALFDKDSTRASVRCKLDKPEEFDPWISVKPLIGALQRRSTLPDAPPSMETGLVAESIRDRNKQLFQAIESEKAMILVISFLIVVAGTSSIFAAQWLLVSDKVREIGILRALGADVNGVVSIFVLNGFLMGVLGAAGGAFGGLLVVRYIDYVHDGISWLLGHRVFDRKIYLFDKIPTVVNYDEVTRYALAALACTLVASAIPAMRAGFMKPAEALHRD